MNCHIVFERRLEPRADLLYLLPVLAVSLALGVGAVILATLGADPWSAYRDMALGAFGSRYGLSETLVKATPILLAALGVGLALTIFATGVCGLWGKSFVGSATSGFALLPLPLLTDISIVGSILFQHDPLVYLGYLSVPLLWLLLYHTRLGLQIRAVGESPGSADAMGVRVTTLRYGCLLAGGMAAGIGGAHLSLAYTQMWIDNMTAGRGWIALAMVIFGAWNPMWTALGAYLFGGVQALQLRLQAFGWQLSPYVLMMAPYVFTIVVLGLASRYTRHRHLRTPAALGTPYAREED